MLRVQGWGRACTLSFSSRCHVPDILATAVRPGSQLPRESPPADSWLQTKSPLRLAIKGKRSAASWALDHTFHALTARKDLLQHQLSGIEEALKGKKRQKIKKRTLPP